MVLWIVKRCQELVEHVGSDAAVELLYAESGGKLPQAHHHHRHVVEGPIAKRHRIHLAVEHFGVLASGERALNRSNRFHSQLPREVSIERQLGSPGIDKEIRLGAAVHPHRYNGQWLALNELQCRNLTLAMQLVRNLAAKAI